jgi:nitroimidazol reductase NimA-like FMN-containing flavoprotein (pyridoxamine 5'-phosphate oxidase superfamily)
VSQAGKEPRASRPKMPGYGILAADQGSGLLPWSWARERLEQSHNYFLATARPDGRPHLMAVWAVWVDDTFCFSTGAESAKARNLAHDPHCAIAIEGAGESVIVEGIAARASDAEHLGAEYLSRAGDAYQAKYPPYKLDPAMGPIFVVRPRVVYGMIEFRMVETATRWEFGGTWPRSRRA